MSLFGSGDSDLGGFIFLAIIGVICLFKIWFMVTFPDIYKAQLEAKKHAAEQRNKLLGPVIGSILSSLFKK